LFWGHHLSEKALRALHPHQVVNHFPGSFGLGRKDYLWRNISRMQRQFGEAYDFCVKSYLFPRDRKHFERDYAEGDVYIVKPPAQAEGRGIRLINRLDQLRGKGAEVVVQRYLGDPYVINNKKFDLRIYVGVTSFDPLRIYVFEEGLARFATTDYHAPDASRKSIKDRYMHLTNYSVNKESEHFERNSDAAKDGEGSKWSLTALWKHLRDAGIDVDALRERIHDLVVKTIISVEHSVVSKMNAFCNGRASCFELFGFDVLLDKALKPWLIEVNVSCSLASSSPLDKRIKSMLMTDLFHMVGVTPYDKKSTVGDAEEKRRARLLRNASEPLKRRNIFGLQGTPLNQLDVDDLGIIMQAEDENRRRGHFTRVLPCANMDSRYLRFFEFARYKNTVLAKWMATPDWRVLAPHLTAEALQSHGPSLVARSKPAVTVPAFAPAHARSSSVKSNAGLSASPSALRPNPMAGRGGSGSATATRLGKPLPSATLFDAPRGTPRNGLLSPPGMQKQVAPAAVVALSRRLDDAAGSVPRYPQRSTASICASAVGVQHGGDAKGMLIDGMINRGLIGSGHRLLHEHRPPTPQWLKS
jgi:tubulin polyglutamylase TTLL4